MGVMLKKESYVCSSFLIFTRGNGRAQARNKWILTAEYCDNSLCYL
jgi:hypothetical protein